MGLAILIALKNKIDSVKVARVKYPNNVAVVIENNAI